MSEPGGDGEPDGLDTVRPRRPLELFLLRLSPGLEGPLAELWKDLSEERKAREIERAGTFLDSVKGDEATLETIVRRMLESERVADLFEGAMDAALRTSLEKKRQALGRVVRATLLDDARVDEAELLLRALGPLEQPHVHLLETLRSLLSPAAEPRMSTWRPLARLSSRKRVRATSEVTGITASQLCAELGSYSEPLVWSLLPVLAAQGLIEERGVRDGANGRDSPAEPKWFVSDFGL